MAQKHQDNEQIPQLLQILAPNEAVVAISMEIRIGEMAGIMNLGIPSITVKMLRQKFDQQWSVRKTKISEDEHARVLRMIQPARIVTESILRGPTLTVESLLAMKEGDVLAFDYPIQKPLNLTFNGVHKFRGEIVGSGRKRAFQVLDPITAE